MSEKSDITCRLCMQPCDLNNRLNDRNFREKAQDILVLYLKIDEDHFSTVCDSCQKQVESFYQFKWKCRQNEKYHLIQNGTTVAVSSTECSEEALSLIPPKDSKPKPLKKLTVKAKKPSKNGRYYIKKTDRVYRTPVRFTKEQLATKTRKELYKERLKEQIKRYYVVCELCGKSVNNSYIASHMNKHWGIQPYACDVTDCGAKFCSQTALKKHTERRHSDGQYPCPQCNKIFTSAAGLRIHMHNHKEKTIFCEICNMGFAVNSRLKLHMLVHTQQRDHECQFCGKAYYTKHVLRLHLRSHTGERPYACHVCDFSHAHRILYVKHMQKFHPGEEIRTLAEIQRQAKVKQRNEQME